MKDYGPSFLSNQNFFCKGQKTVVTISILQEKSNVQYLPVPKFPGYWAGDDGSIWSNKKNGFRRLKPYILRGYEYIPLRKDNRKHKIRVHKIILECFVGKAPKGMITRHLNGIKTDNRLCNLKWGTHKENEADKTIHGTRFFPVGERNGSAKIVADQAREVMRLWDEGFSKKNIASTLEISKGIVSQVVTGASWTHLFPERNYKVQKAERRARD